MSTKENDVFNTNLEAGVRAICILDCLYPKVLDFEQLIKTDFILVNSGDFGGPPSLHPKVPNRKGELVTRRSTIRAGIDLMRRFGLIEVELTISGVNYTSTEQSRPYLKLMNSSYSKSIQLVAKWLSEEINRESFSRLDEVLAKVIYK